MSRVVHFDIPASDVERAIKFYNAVFGWRFNQMNGHPYWLQEREEGSAVGGGIAQRSGDTPADGMGANAYVCTIGVESIDETLEKIVAAGGSIVSVKMDMGVGFFAGATDTEGNRFQLLEQK